MRHAMYAFMFGMWLLMLAGGWLVVSVLGPIPVDGPGEYDRLAGSAAKAAAAVLLVAAWVLALSKFKNWMFRKELKF